MSVPLEEPPALDSGSVSTLSEVTSASVIQASTSCTLEANTNVMVRKSRHCFVLLHPVALKDLFTVVMGGTSGAEEGTVDACFNGYEFWIHIYFILLICQLDKFC